MRIGQSLVLAVILWGSSAGIASADTVVWDATWAPADAYAQNSAQHAVWLPGLDAIVGTTAWRFEGNGKFTEIDEMSATLTGTIRPISGAPFGFVVNAMFENDGTYTPTPKLELKGSAYAPGGPVDPSTWHFYKMVSPSTLTGFDGFNGVTLNLSHKPADHSMGFQVGEGANGKNVLMGMSGWFFYDVEVDPIVKRIRDLPRTGSGDFNVNLTPTPEPGTFVLLTAAIAAGLVYRRRRGI